MNDKKIKTKNALTKSVFRKDNLFIDLIRIPACVMLVMGVAGIFASYEFWYIYFFAAIGMFSVMEIIQILHDIRIKLYEKERK